MFKKFEDLPFDQLPENEDFRAHALQVTESISLAVSAMDDVDGLVMVLKDLGAAHSTQGLQDAHFDVSSAMHHIYAKQLLGTNELLVCGRV